MIFEDICFIPVSQSNKDLASLATSSLIMNSLSNSSYESNLLSSAR